MLETIKRLGELCLAGVIGVALGYVLAWIVRPEEHLPSSSLVLLTGDWCPKSQQLVQQIHDDPELAQRVLLLDITSGGDTRDCDRIVDAVTGEAPWLRLAGREWICERLTRHAALLHEDHFTGLPAWLHGGRPVPVTDERAVLSRSGLTLCPGPALYVGAFPCPRPPAPRAAGDARVEAVEQGQDIGF